MKKSLIVLLIGLTPAPAQRFSFGMKGGVPLTAFFDTATVAIRGGIVGYSSDTRRYTFGPVVEWRLTGHAGMELNALYRRFGYHRAENTSVSGVTTISSLTSRGTSWDFPVLAKYRWQSRVTPFVSAGFALRYMRPGRTRGVSTVQTSNGTITTPVDTDEGAPLFIPGAAAAIGVEFGRGRVRLIPEFRYTRWRNTTITDVLHVAANQAEFLVGLLF
jgi:hypothetical protein